MTIALGVSVSDLYRGPLPDFIRHRDALAKQMRANGDREGADRIKSLRKPSRTAWALNVATASPLYEQLVAAVRATVTAQAKGRDVRGAMADMRDAVRALAAHASETASAQGQVVETALLASAIHAVLGDTESFELLQRGELVDVPEAGGLDFLATMSAAPTLRVSSNRSPDPAAPTPTPVPPKESKGKANQERKAREALARAETELVELRKRTDDALRMLNQAESALEAAERRVDEATKSADAARASRDTARATTAQLTSQMKVAEQNAAELRNTLGEITHGD